MHHLRFRQIHLDFHTSPAIEGIGKAFDKAQWQAALKTGHVDSVTAFSKCHHGWSYHETSVGKRHPHLDFDLLTEQFNAAKEIDVNVPIYLSAGVDNLASYEHPEWREVGPDGRYTGWARDVTQAGFHKICFHSPYLDYLCLQIEEAVRLYPTCDGVFLDIVSHGQCCCRWCLEVMHREGLDATVEVDRIACSQLALQRYYERTTAACKVDDADMPVFHNSGHIPRGKRDILKYFSHLELESLPTGGWGYDHFPISAKYCQNLPHDFLGMTGKFHTTWGEFGGYKHPNALRYECAAMLAFGSKCSVGDQLHPSGTMDTSTYELIGQAYGAVETKEPWCDHVESVADIGLLSVEAAAELGARDVAADIGAGRALLEGHFLFDVLDTTMDFGKYKLLILPDKVQIDTELKARLDAYLAEGGKLLLTGSSGLDSDGFVFDIGATWHGQSEFQPDFILPRDDLRAEWIDQPQVMYAPSQRIKATSGESLGDVYDPYFNRTFEHFCSHQHAPARPDASGYDIGVRNGNIAYLAHPFFTLYRGFAAVAYRHIIERVIRLMLDEPTLEATMPSTARVSLMDQPEQSRYVLHLLYANTIARGGAMNLAGGSVSRDAITIEVIEDLLPLRDAAVTLRLPRKVTQATLEPQGQTVDINADGQALTLKVDEFTCHQMIVLSYT